MESPRREEANRIAQAWSLLPEVEGVILYGSVSRGEDTDLSDIDLQVILSDQTEDVGGMRGKLRKALPKDSSDQKVIFLSLLGDFEQKCKAGAFDISPLWDSGMVIYDRNNLVEPILLSPHPRAKPTEKELERMSHDLESAASYPLEMYNGLYLLILSRLYRSSRTLVVASLGYLGETESRRSHAFPLLASLRPELAEDLKVVAALEPFYLKTEGRPIEDKDYPFPSSSRSNVEEALKACQNLSQALGCPSPRANSLC